MLPEKVRKMRVLEVLVHTIEMYKEEDISLEFLDECVEEIESIYSHF